MRCGVSRYPAKAVPLALPQILGIGTDGMAWCDTLPTGGIRWHGIEWPADCDAPGYRLAFADLWNQSIARRAWAPAVRTTVCLSCGLVRHWLQTPPIGIQSLSELRAVADARAKLLFGSLPGQSWPASGEWDALRPFVCTALASQWEPLLQAIQHTHRNASTLDAFSLVFSQCRSVLPKEGWLAIASEDRLFLMHRSKGYASSLRSLQIPTFGMQADSDAVALGEWHRESANQNTDERLHWFSVPAGGYPVSGVGGVAPIQWDAQAALGLGTRDKTLRHLQGSTPARRRGGCGAPGSACAVGQRGAMR